MKYERNTLDRIQKPVRNIESWSISYRKEIIVPPVREFEIVQETTRDDRVFSRIDCFHYSPQNVRGSGSLLGSGSCAKSDPRGKTHISVEARISNLKARLEPLL